MSAPKPESLQPPVATTKLAASAARPISPSTVDSRVLFAGGSELVIFHYGETYQLRQTRLGKLILTK